MSQDIQELHGLLKQASAQLRTAQEVIYTLAEQNQELAHGLQARDLAIKLASTGRVPMTDIPEKVAELESKTDSDLELEEKVASMTGGFGHSLHSFSGSAGATSSAMDFLS